MKKFIYIDDISGSEKEQFAYEVSDFVTIATPDSPVKTLPSGTLHPSLIPATPIGAATSLVVSRIAEGDILKGDVVRASDTLGKVQVADSNTLIEDATVMGLATNDALDGETVEVIVLGVITDAIFNVFPVNAALFLDLGGAITDDRPIGPGRKFLTYIGKSLGGGDVLVTVNPPITIGG
jgi:hypothetical protein